MSLIVGATSSEGFLAGLFFYLSVLNVYAVHVQIHK